MVEMVDDTVSDMEVDKVMDMEVDKVSDELDDMVEFPCSCLRPSVMFLTLSSWWLKNRRTRLPTLR